jgi:hypothetical protein
MAAVAPGLVLRIFLMSPRKSANSSFRMARHVGHLSRTCRTVIAPSSHAQRLLHTPGTFLSYRKFENPIFPVRSCVSSALCAFVLPAWRWRFSCVGSGVNLWSSLPFELPCHLFFHSSSALSLIFVSLVLGLIWRASSWFLSACLSLVLRLRGAGVFGVVSHGARGRWAIPLAEKIVDEQRLPELGSIFVRERSQTLYGLTIAYITNLSAEITDVFEGEQSAGREPRNTSFSARSKI